MRKMLAESEFLNNAKNGRCSHCSLCERCQTENTEKGWNCQDINATPFLRAKKFCQGTDLCPKNTPDMDCLYKYGNNLILIETKAQPLRNIDKEQLLRKLTNAYRNLGELSLQAFILQISSRLNSGKTHNQLLLSCDEMFKALGLRLGKNSLLYSRNPNLCHIRTRFYVFTCKDLNEEAFIALL